MSRMQTLSPVQNQGSDDGPGKDKSHFRKDIQGLRAIAVVLVLLYHAGVPFFPGGFVGVDVFFVISGFLITGILLRELRKDGRISLTAFYARRARRILPAAGVVLVAVVALTVLVLPKTRWMDIGGQVMASVFYVVNWIFASSSVDYLAKDQAPSPVQHFWSLAVEEQYYIVWPVLLIGAAWLARSRSQRGRGRSRYGVDPQRLIRLIPIALAVVAIPSLAWSIFYTGANSGAAYFVTTTRLWELAVGAGVSVFVPQLKNLTAPLAHVLGWGGLASVIAAGVLYSGAMPFPGAAALLPTLGSAAVIAAGVSRSDRGVGSVLGVRLATWVGGISYSLYLWHWPLIVVATYVFGGLSLVQGLAVVAISLVPAYLSYRFIEVPVQKSKALSYNNSRTIGLAVISSLAAAVLALGPMLAIGQQPAPATARPVAVAPAVTAAPGATAAAPVALLGAELLAKNPSLGKPKDSVPAFEPTALTAADDNPPVYADGCHQSETQVEPMSCVYGAKAGKFTVALVGDSHAAQWVPALQAVAIKNGWKLETYTKSSCPLADLDIAKGEGAEVYTTCRTWNENIQKALAASKPNVVVTSSLLHIPVINGARTSDAARIQAMGDGLHASWTRLADAGIPIVSIVDTPFMGIDVPECVAANEKSLTKCAVAKEKTDIGGGQPEAIGAAGLKSVSVINLNAMICPDTLCAPVIGNVLIYRDAAHMTATYSRSLATALDAKLIALKPFAAAPKPGAP
jgi:peptidoglycan/LPS O-acetylase OafA/YrhL